MSASSSPILRWLRRPQFSLRTFLILITAVALPLAVVGAIKFKAYSVLKRDHGLGGRQIDRQMWS